MRGSGRAILAAVGSVLVLACSDGVLAQDCPYGSVQARVQRNEQEHWTPALAIGLGESFRVGGFRDNSGLFADCCVGLRVSGPNGYDVAPPIGSYLTPPEPGTYTLTATCGSLSDSATVTVAPPSCPYGSIQARVQRNEQEHWTPALTIGLGESFRVGGFRDNSGLFADCCVGLRVTGPNGYDIAPPIGSYLTPPEPGTYALTATCGGLQDGANVTVVGPEPGCTGVRLDTASSTSADGPTVIWTHTVSGENRLLLVGVYPADGAGVDAVRYAGRELTFLVGGFTPFQSSLWALVDPPSGTHLVEVETSSAAVVIAGASSWADVHPAEPFGDRTSVWSSGSSLAAVTLHSQPGELVIDFLAAPGGGPVPAGASQAVSWSRSAHGRFAGSSHLPGSLTTTSSWSLAPAAPWGLSTVAIRHCGSSPRPVVRVEAEDTNASEAGGAAAFRIIRTGGIGDPLAISYVLTGTATAGSDYLAPASITIPGGEASALVDVQAVDDSDVEGDETVTLTLLDTASYNASIRGEATVMIRDDDDEDLPPRPAVSIVASDDVAAEGGDTAAFVLMRTGDLSRELAVSLLVGGSVTPDVDYQRFFEGTATATVRIPAGAATTTLSIVPVDDSEVEGPETLTLSVFDADWYDVGTPASASVAILDNDGSLPTVSLLASDRVAREGGDTASFVLMRTGDLSQPLPVSLHLAGSARHDLDYPRFFTTITPEAVVDAVIPAGFSTTTLLVSPIDDFEAEGPEDVILVVAGKRHYSLGTPMADSVTIEDNDVPPRVTVVAVDPVAREGGDAALIVVRRTGDTRGELPVSFRVEGTATPDVDYQRFFVGSTTAAVVIPPGASSTTIAVRAVDDSEVEGPETLRLVIADMSWYDPGTPASAIVTIRDNDALITLRVVDGSASEGGDPGRFVVSRTGGDLTTPLNVRLRLGGAAQEGTDYLSFVDGPAGSNLIRLGPGEASRAVAVRPRDDRDVEGPETLTIALDASPSYRIGSPGNGVVTITDDDRLPRVGVFGVDGYAAEQGRDPAVFEVRRDGDLSGPLTVRLATAGTASAADYSGIPATVTLAPGQRRVLITMRPVDDSVPEPTETVVLRLLPSPRYEIGVREFPAEIADNDRPPPIVAIRAVDPFASESGDPGRFVVTRSGPLDDTLGVDISVGGTSTFWDHFLTTGPVLFGRGQRAVTITVRPNDDSSIEFIETVVLTVQPGARYVVDPGQASAQVWIYDNDWP
jgi:hypothetical protein